MGGISKAALTVLVAAAAVPVWGADGGSQGMGLWIGLLLAFGALVVVTQVVPAAVMFVSLLRGLWGRRDPAEVGVRRRV